MCADTLQKLSTVARRGSEKGAALIAALSMLMIFTLLGTSYVKYMSIEQDASMFELRKMRASHLAEGGIQAAIGEIRAALKSGQTPEAVYEFDIPVYIYDADAEIRISAVPQRVRVRIEDEAARVNLNHAPRELLESLGMDRSRVRALKNSLPKGSVPRAGTRQWLSSVDNLRTRKILGAREFRALDRDILTVHTVDDPHAPARFINLNSASPKVLAAVFNIPQQEAAALAKRRPFTSWNDVVAKTGRDPLTFSVRPSQISPHTMPRELALQSNCYRVFSEARVESSYRAGHDATQWVEAVVVLHADGSYTFRYWNEMAPQDRTQVAQNVDSSDMSAAVEETGSETGSESPAVAPAAQDVAVESTTSAGAAPETDNP